LELGWENTRPNIERLGSATCITVEANSLINRSKNLDSAGPMISMTPTAPCLQLDLYHFGWEDVRQLLAAEPHEQAMAGVLT